MDQISQVKPRIHFKVIICNASCFWNVAHFQLKSYIQQENLDRNPMKNTKKCLLRKWIKKCFNGQNEERYKKRKRSVFTGSVKINVIRKSESWEMKRERNMKEAYFSRPKMKALSLILWLVSSEYWLTLENRLCKTRVEGPRTERININHFFHLHPFNNHHHDYSSHTKLCGSLDHTPGPVFALSNDQVQYIHFQSIVQYLTNGRTQVL